MTTPLSASTSTSPVPNPPVRNDQMGKDAFLKLLVAQLKYQDPMNPAEGSEFMAQTAQFSMVEKMDELTAANAQLLSSSRALGASSLIGRAVVYAGADGVDKVATVSGVRFGPTGPVLLVGDTEVSLAGVKEVRPAGS